MTAGRVRSRLIALALVLVLIAALVPFAWMTVSSFKTPAELGVRPPTWWPQHPTLDNYTVWFTDLGLVVHFTNSLGVALVVVAGNLVFCSMLGYALAKLEFGGKRVLFALVMGTLMVPAIVTMIPMFVLVAGLGLVDTYPALILPFLVTPIGVFLMRQYLQEVPDSHLDAARLDGAGEFRILFRIVLPQCGGALLTLATLTFLSSWNNFLWPLVVAQSEERYTLPVALSLRAIGPAGTQYGLLMAGCVLVLVPVLVLYLVFQRFVIRGMTATATTRGTAVGSDG